MIDLVLYSIRQTEAWQNCKRSDRIRRYGRDSVANITMGELRHTTYFDALKDDYKVASK